MMNKILKAAMTVAATLFAFGVYAQDVIVDPEVSYAGTPRECIIGGITVTHFENTPDFTLIGLSGTAGVIGYDFFNRFKVLFNYASRKIYLV